MEDQNIIIFLDEIKKLLELGNKPKAIAEIDALIITLERSMALKKGKRFPFVLTETYSPKEIAGVVNQITSYLNKRFPL